MRSVYNLWLAFLILSLIYPLDTPPLPLESVEINIQIRTIETVPAIGTGDLAIALVHLMPAAVTDVFVFGTLSRFLL